MPFCLSFEPVNHSANFPFHDSHSTAQVLLLSSQSFMKSKRACLTQFLCLICPQFEVHLWKSHAVVLMGQYWLFSLRLYCDCFVLFCFRFVLFCFVCSVSFCLFYIQVKMECVAYCFVLFCYVYFVLFVLFCFVLFVLYSSKNGMCCILLGKMDPSCQNSKHQKMLQPCVSEGLLVTVLYCVTNNVVGVVGFGGNLLVLITLSMPRRGRINPFVPGARKMKSANLTLNWRLMAKFAREVICLNAHHSVLWGFMGWWCLWRFMAMRP